MMDLLYFFAGGLLVVIGVFIFAFASLVRTRGRDGN